MGFLRNVVSHGSLLIMHRRLYSFCLACILAGSTCGVAGAEDAFERPPISYSRATPDNPVARLQAEMESGAATLRADAQGSYLPALLEALEVPVESQVLVFSRTSLQREWISPANPRAIYFNDDIYVGTVPGSGLIEVSVADAQLGAVFYSFSERAQTPGFARERDTCLQCHSGNMTGNIPGHMMRSVYTTEDGFPILKAGTKVTTQNSPYEERWGGWYVTGRHGAARHMGNVLAVETAQGVTLDVDAGANWTTLGERVDTRKYLSPHSDLVAHQVQAHNLLTQASFETRMALRDQAAMDEVLGRDEGRLSDSTRSRISNAGEKLLRYMLFDEEPPLKEPVGGTSRFSTLFARVGPRDAQGRSLRDLDLETRLFKYPLSYLIYSPQFDGLPREMKDYLYRRLWDILTGTVKRDKDVSLGRETRRAILEILLETKSDLPGYWREQ
jgi:hypothetical protein